MRFALVILAAFLSMAAPSRARTWHVPTNAPTIHAGIDSAAAGDTVAVECGVYYEHLISMKSGVTLRSVSGDPACVTIDAQGADRGIRCSRVTGVVIEGITVTHGGTYDGMDVAVSNVTIARCIFENSRYGIGIGNGVESASSARSTALADGPHGLRANPDPLSVDATDCVFRGNGASTTPGAGVFILWGGTHTFTRCLFQGNRNVGWLGGGIYVDGAIATFDDCQFVGNACSSFGGGAAGWGSALHFRNCVFSENTATAGGGLGEVSTGLDQLDNCVFAHNHASGFTLDAGGGAIWSYHSAAQIRNCTLVANTAQGRGAALLCSGASAPTVDRSIMAFNEGGAVVWVYLNDRLPTLSCCDLFGNENGDWVHQIADQAGLRGNFSADPLFCDAAGGTWTVRSDSPCAPPGVTGCGLVGALDVGCATVSIQPSTWARIKGVYR